MQSVVIFTDDPGWHGKQLRQAFLSRGYQAHFVSLTDCQLVIDGLGLPVRIPGFERQLPRAAFVRGVPGGSLEQVTFFLDILHALKQLGVPVYNDARAIEHSVDKAMTSFKLQLAGVPTPKTWVLNQHPSAVSVAEQQLNAGQTVIVKPLFGSQGEGIRRLEKSTDLMWLTSSRGIYYLQQFVECQGDGYSDIRVFVINGQAVAAMRRRGVSWLNNVARGARCEALDLSAEWSDLAVKAAAVLEMDYAGVDIIQAQTGDAMVIEVNSVPAWKGLQSVCELSIADALVDDLVNRYALAV